MLKELFERKFVYLDGAMGTMLQKNGLKAGFRPDIMNMTAPDVVEKIQRQYAEAGSDILLANMFGANAIALKGTGYSPENIITSAVKTAKRAGKGKTLTALDIGPLGVFLEPLGELKFEDAYDMFREEAVAGEQAGADLAVIETMSDLYEVKAAMLAVRENTSLPVFVMMTFDKTGSTFTGCKPDSFAVTAESLGAAALGINCSLAPREILKIARLISERIDIPLVIKPNAGLPNSVTGLYDISPEEFANEMEQFIPLGVKVVGGCCGTTPEYVSELRHVFESRAAVQKKAKPGFFICTPMHAVNLEDMVPLSKSGCDVSENYCDIESVADWTDEKASAMTVRLPGDPQASADIVRKIQDLNSRPMILVSDSARSLEAALRAVNGRAAVAFPEDADRSFTDVAAKYGAPILIIK